MDWILMICSVIAIQKKIIQVWVCGRNKSICVCVVGGGGGGFLIVSD